MSSLARISYFVTVAVCTTLSVFSAARLLPSLLERNPWFDAGREHFYTAAAIAAFLIPCARAVVRMVRRASLLPGPQNSNTRAYLILITVTGILGHIVTALTTTAYVDIRMNHLSDVSGIGGAMITAAALYLITLWVGELVVATSGGHPAEDSNPFQSS